MRILIAPSGYKECLEADRVAEAIATGVMRAMPEAEVDRFPLVDGGEGFARTMAMASGGQVHEHIVTGPTGQAVAALLGEMGGDGPRTFLVEMAQAAGLRLVPPDARDPTRTTTRGVGELIRAALDRGAERIIVGCGDSGTNDGGAGMAAALGCRLLDGDGDAIGPGSAGLAKLARIELETRDSRLEAVTIEAALNITTRLCGPRGVARLFGPQKGADEATIVKMEAALGNYAAVLRRDVGIDVADMPGGGASGGLGAGLAALLGATLRSRYDIIFATFDLEARLASADLVLTAEGGIDLQTPQGKIPVEVARRSKLRGLPVLALAGQVGEPARIVYEHGIDAFFSTTAGPCTMEAAMRDAESTLALSAENVMRAVLAGQRLAK